MLYTRKGDGGTTKTLKQGPGERVSKNSAIAEALGTLDEVNSLLGVCKVKAPAPTAKILARAQHNLFIVQAELAGAEKTIAPAKVKETEEIIDGIERELPPIKSFFVAGGTELAASLDHARTVARRAERRVVAAVEQGAALGEHTRSYLNRLSSLLYALARLANHESGIKEEPPTYS
jgi:cob(I)alamin adenosyltransferase